MPILSAVTALSLGLLTVPLTPVFSMAVGSDEYTQGGQTDSENPAYYKLKKGGKSGWGGASCKHPLNTRPYTI